MKRLEQSLHATPRTRGFRYWRGHDFWMTDAAYYRQLYPEPPLVPEGWEGRHDPLTNPGLACDVWWSASGIGLRDRLYDEIRNIINRESQPGADDFMVLGSGVGAMIPANAPDWRKDQIVNSFLERKAPPASDTIGTDDGIWRFLTGTGSLLVYPFFKIAMTALIVGLPMIQAFILACIYIALPLAIPFALTRPGVIVYFAAAIFSIKFLTGIWAMANFIDERLIRMMYGLNGIQAGTGTAPDALLLFVSAASYAGCQSSGCG